MKSHRAYTLIELCVAMSVGSALLVLSVGLLHQALNEWATGTQGLELWSLLALDSLVVGLIVANTPAAMVRVARWVEMRRSAEAAFATATPARADG